MTLHFGLIFASKTAAWTWFAYSALFAHAFLGRYRVAFGIILIVALAELSKWGLPISQFCAFQLVDRRFAFERLLFPASGLADFVKTLPALTAAIERAGNEIVIRPRYQGYGPGKLVCLIDHPTVIGQDIRWQAIGSDGAVHLPQREITSATILYMLGWSVKGLPWPVFEPWTGAAAPE